MFRPALRDSVDLRIQTYTEAVPLKCKKLATKYPSENGYFYSVVRRTATSTSRTTSQGAAWWCNGYGVGLATLIANPHRPTQRNSTVDVRYVWRCELNWRQSARVSLNTFIIILLFTPSDADATHLDRRVASCRAV